ncbi:ribosome maturation protein, partial [Lasiosphaeria miniovina]
ATATKIHYQGSEDDFIVFVDSAEDYQKWLDDKSTALANVVSSFQVFVTHKHGAQGPFDTASKGSLEAEFGSEDEEVAIKKILEEGTLQESQMGERNGSRNDADGAMV